MRGRTFPAVNSVLARSVSSYVQVNIYDTSLKKLRARGVDIKHLLQHVGCRSVVMDVPIFSSELRKLDFACRRLNKSFGGFSSRVQSSRLEKSRRYSESFAAHETICSVQEQSLVTVREEGSIEESAVEEFADCRTDFDTTVIRGTSIGPLTSTPMPSKTGNSLASFANPKGIADDCRLTTECLEQTLSKIPGKMDGATLTSHMNMRRPYFDLEASAIAKDEPAVDYGIELSVEKSPVVESSFTVFQTAAVQGLNTINGFKAQPLNSAVIFGGNSQQQDAEIHQYSYEDDGFCHSDYLVIADPEDEPQHEINDVQNNLVGVERELVANDRSISSHKVIKSDIAIMKCSPISTLSGNAVNDSHSNPTIAEPDPVAHCASEGSENVAMEIQSDTTKNKVATPSNRANSGRGRRKRVRAPTSEDRQDSEREETELGSVETGVKRTAKSKSAPKGEGDTGKRIFHCQIPLCQKTLAWRPRYGKNRLVDHVRTHWGRAVKQCKLCDYRASNFRQVHHHHTIAHPDQPYLGALSIETKEDLEELLELWKQCFPNDRCTVNWLINQQLPEKWT